MAEGNYEGRQWIESSNGKREKLGKLRREERMKAGDGKLRGEERRKTGERRRGTEDREYKIERSREKEETG
jgi:hypothetical protein